MINQEIAQIFTNMAAYIDMSEEKNAFFRSRALRKAAEVVDRFPYDFGEKEWHEDVNKLISLEGIGKSTAEYIQEYVHTRTIKEYERMKNESPVKLEELLQIQGVGPKRILRLYKELGITDTETLKKAAEDNLISQLEGFGPKSQENILESISFSIKNKGRVLYPVAEYEVEKLLAYLKMDKNIEAMEPTGSFRRKKETIGDIDILVSSKDPAHTVAYFIQYPDVEKILAQGETKASLWLKSKIQADLRVVPIESYGAALQYFTGSKEHNVSTRNRAIRFGYKLSEYGLFNRKTDELITAKTEKDIYTALKLDLIPPELREDAGEIEAAERHTLPDLIELEDIKGDLQMHTTFSDGEFSVIEMAEEAKKLGYSYIGITDHFGKLKIAGAIDEKEFDDYLTAIREADKKVDGIRIYAGAEVEIGTDGSLEFDEEKLEQLDYVLATIHFSFKMSEEEMTKRIVKAIQHPLTKILAHPTGRILNERPGYTYQYESVFAEAQKRRVALEINADPSRLDLSDTLAHMAKDIGCTLSINTDAHSKHSLPNMRYGINVARRAWLTSSDVLNTRTSPFI